MENEQCTSGTIITRNCVGIGASRHFWQIFNNSVKFLLGFNDGLESLLFIEQTNNDNNRKSISLVGTVIDFEFYRFCR